MSSFQSQLQQFFSARASDSGLVVAYSGGPDSHALLLGLTRLQLTRHGSLRAVHVNHGLHPQADEWAAYCMAAGKRLGVDVQVWQVEIDRAGSSLEEAARDARYAALMRALDEGEALVTAHTLEDQSETVLLQLFRGAGPAGLAAMAGESTISGHHLYRPLLSVSKQTLLDYLRENRESFVVDPANIDQRFDRSFLRSAILPMLRQRWPQVDRALSRAAHLQASASHLVETQAHFDLSKCLTGQTGEQLNCAHWIKLRGESEYRALNVLRSWLRQTGLRAPSRSRLLQLVQEVVLARSDAQPCFKLDEEYELRRSGGYLHIVGTEQSPPRWTTLWCPPARLDLPHGSLSVVEAPGGLDPAVCEGKTWLVAPRRGGETLRLSNRAGRRKVKKLFQELQVPPWCRASLPFVFDGEVVVAVADLWLNRDYLAAPSQTGWTLKWTIK